MFAVSSPTRRSSYKAKEKLTIIAYEEEHGNRAAGRKFGVNESTVRTFRKKKTEIEAMLRQKRANRGKQAACPRLEDSVVNWISERRAQGCGISTLETRMYALKMAKELNIPVTDFKASVNWCYRFMSRHSLSVRRRTHIAQKLPRDFEDKLVEFQKFIIKLRKDRIYPMCAIGNADQTPLTFDMPYNTTVAPTGSKSVTIRTTGAEKSRFTVMLACTADGGKLPPYVIFRRKTMPKEKFPKGIIIRVHEKGWMDEKLMSDWIQTVWAKREGGLLHRGLLVLDAFRCHRWRMASIKAQLLPGRSRSWPSYLEG